MLSSEEFGSIDIDWALVRKAHRQAEVSNASFSTALDNNFMSNITTRYSKVGSWATIATIMHSTKL